ncbi:protein trichome birefringence-like 19 [Phalaenopsis equestris]|uniref:protein trichome birefringence-like 19 n=1 Tax=Phalaenopsis equestris TaxID=78828 RepID=UPI0009E1A386|nr:protein trichome birefringence-like 19 [Phalaenopsis equestris]
MKSKGLDLTNGRTGAFTLFSVFKFIVLSSVAFVFLNISLPLYTIVSTRYNFSIKQPILKFASSSSTSNSVSFPIYQSNYSNNTRQGASSTTPSAKPSANSNSISSLLLLQSPTVKLVQNSSAAASFSNDKLNSSVKKQIGRQRILQKGCDLSKGEWVQDPNAPYYTNSTCWMIQEHQNCIKFGRPNLDFLKWRWKPDGCELPLLDPAQFLEKMRGKILAFVGDSLARNQMQSLMCLLSRAEFPKEMPSTEENQTRMFYESHNFTIWFFWSPFLVRAAQSNHTLHSFPSWNLYLDEPDPLWPSLLPNFNFVVLNSGNWYTRPSLFHLNRTLVGCHYCPIPNPPYMSLRRAHRHAFRTALNTVAAARRRGFKGLTVVRTVSPSHFEGGEWDKGGDCARTKPFRGGEEAPRLEGLEKEMYEEQLKEFWKAKWEGSEVGLEFRLLDATKAMLMRADGHPSKHGHSANEVMVMYNDCVHWCLPGPVDMWNDFLFQIIDM